MDHSPRELTGNHTMNSKSYHCTRCNAPLAVVKEGDRVACQYCRTPQQVGGAIPPHSAKSTELASGGQAAIDNALKELDCKWEREKRKYEVDDGYGYRYMPSVIGSKTIVVVSFCGAVIVACLLPVLDPEWSIFVLLTFIGTVGLSSVSYYKARAYDVALRRYLANRAALEREKSLMRNSNPPG